MSVVLTTVNLPIAGQPASSAAIEVIELDASLKEDVSYESEVTEHPVEQGANVTDNVRVKLITVTIEGIFSDFPLTESSKTSPPAKAETGRAKDMVRSRLVQWWTSAQVLRVETPLTQYGTMVIQSLTVPHDVQSGDSFHFTIKLKEIRLVQTQTVQITIPKKKVSKGVVSGTQVPSPVAPNPSPAVILVDGISNGKGKIATAKTFGSYLAGQTSSDQLISEGYWNPPQNFTPSVP